VSDREATAAPRAPVVAPLGDLVARMRADGVDVGVGELLAAHRALAAVDPGAPEDSRLALRATLCAGRADLAAFDAAFEAIFGPGELVPPARPPIDPTAAMALPRVAVPDAGRPGPMALEPDTELRPAAWSSVELLGAKDFGEYTDAERLLARRLMGELARRGPTRASRRQRTARRGVRPDLRATLRTSLRHAGEPLERRWRVPTTTPRPLVLVLDVSGSMEPYARMLLQYAQACVAARRRTEVFAFGTRLTRITNELRGRDPDRALDRAAETVEDWSGGTRIGAAVGELNRVHGRRIGRGAVVVVLSDGWDRGDPEELAAELARLHRCAHRLVWLNPLKAHPEYEPLVRGMRAALPHLDAFLAGNSLASLAELADLMEATF